MLLALAILGAHRTARAEGPSEASRVVAQTLFEQGRALLEQGRYAEACPKFAESQRLDPGGGTLLNLALCHELEGKAATAWAEFHEALTQAQRDDRADRVQFARDHLDGLAASLTKVAVRIPSKAVQLDVRLDDIPLPHAAWNLAIPVNPGRHRLVVTAPGAPRWEITIEATAPGQTYDVDVPMPIAQDCHEQPCQDASARGRRSNAFWVLLSGAGVALATSAATGIAALVDAAYVKNNCMPERNFCRVDDAGDAASRARTYAWVSTGALAVAAGATAAAFLWPRVPRESSPVAISPTPIRGGAALGLVVHLGM